MLPVARRCVSGTGGRRRRPTTPRHRFHIWTGSAPASWHHTTYALVVQRLAVRGEEGFFFFSLKSPANLGEEDRCGGERTRDRLSLSQLGRVCGNDDVHLPHCPGCWLFDTGYPAPSPKKQNKTKSLLLEDVFGGRWRRKKKRVG